MALATRALVNALPTAAPRVLSLAVQRRGFFRSVHQGYEGYRLFLGSSPKRLLPGLRLSLPIVHSTQLIDVRECSQTIDKLHGFTSDNVPVTVAGVLFHQVQDSYKACFAVADYKKSVLNIGISAMRAALGTFTYDQIISDREQLNRKLQTGLMQDLKPWGLICTRFECSDFKPANEQVSRQLELQMEAERHRRKQLLDTEAGVNVASGTKRQAILISEGEAAAVVNNAQAEREKMAKQAAGLADQVEALAKSMVCEKEKVTQEHRQRALGILVELKRIDQLGQIASSDANSVYFMNKAEAGLEDQAYTVDLLERLKQPAHKA